MRSAHVLAVIAGSACLSLAAHAGVVYSFTESCTNNNAGDVIIGMTQMTVDVSDPGGNQVDFTFMNSGPAASSITDLYWDDGSLLGIASIVSGPGTSFSQGASPGNLPGGNDCDPPFVTTVSFSADSDPPSQPNGVNPGEYVTVRFNLIGGGTYADVINEMNTAVIRVGIHVQGYDSGGSEAFHTVPAPGAAMLLALGGLALRRRR